MSGFNHGFLKKQYLHQFHGFLSEYSKVTSFICVEMEELLWLSD